VGELNQRKRNQENEIRLEVERIRKHPNNQGNLPGSYAAAIWRSSERANCLKLIQICENNRFASIVQNNKIRKETSDGSFALAK